MDWCVPLLMMVDKANALFLPDQLQRVSLIAVACRAAQEDSADVQICFNDDGQ